MKRLTIDFQNLICVRQCACLSHSLLLCLFFISCVFHTVDVNQGNTVLHLKKNQKELETEREMEEWIREDKGEKGSLAYSD